MAGHISDTILNYVRVYWFGMKQTNFETSQNTNIHEFEKMKRDEATIAAAAVVANCII